MSIINEVDQMIETFRQEEGIELGNIDEKSQDLNGLGDAIERVLGKLGINEEKVAAMMGIGGCGCQARKQFLNKLFPFRKKRPE